MREAYRLVLVGVAPKIAAANKNPRFLFMVPATPVTVLAPGARAAVSHTIERSSAQHQERMA
jgi:hypothetical protein